MFIVCYLRPYTFWGQQHSATAHFTLIRYTIQEEEKVQMDCRNPIMG